MALSKSNRDDLLWLIAAFGLGLLMVWFDLHTDDTGIVAGLLFIFGGLLGMGRPYGAWRWALALGLCVPAGEFLTLALGLTHQPLSQATGSLLALIFAFVGVYAGVLLRRAAQAS